jgi:hypothetical protein
LVHLEERRICAVGIELECVHRWPVFAEGENDGTAPLWGLLFFAEIPDAITVGGIILIAAAGILAVR